MIKLSIIIPVYNTEKYLHRCIESVLRQKKEWLELIIVDDGSNDVCADLCEVKSKFVCKFIFQLCGFIYATFIFKRFD